MRGNTNMQQNTLPPYDATRYGSVLARNCIYIHTLRTNSRDYKVARRATTKSTATICREKCRHVTNKLKPHGTKQPTMWGNTIMHQTTWPTYDATCHGSVLARNNIDIRYAQTRDYNCTTRNNKNLPATTCREKHKMSSFTYFLVCNRFTNSDDRK